MTCQAVSHSRSTWTPCTRRPCWSTHRRSRPVRAWRRRFGAGEELMPRGRGSGPLRDIAPRVERMADFIDRFENELFGGMETFFPTVTREGMRIAMDVREEDDRYTITADLPGMTKSDVKIEVSPERVLTISGERQTEHKEEGESYYRSERRFGKFFRSFHLPKNADEANIKALAKEGVVEISIPKVEKDSGNAARVIDID